MPPRVLIADASRMHRELLAAFLHERQFAVTAVPLRDALPALRAADPPDVVLLSAADGDGPAAVCAVRAAAPGVAVLVYAVAEEEEAVLPCLEAGAAGYHAAEWPLEELCAGVRAALRGELLCSPRIAAALRRRVTAAADVCAEPAPHPLLTPREREIAALIDQGLSNKEIARRLSLSVLTVKNHVHRILGKLQVSRRGQAAARLRRRG